MLSGLWDYILQIQTAHEHVRVLGLCCKMEPGSARGVAVVACQDQSAVLRVLPHGLCQDEFDFLNGSVVVETGTDSTTADNRQGGQGDIGEGVALEVEAAIVRSEERRV